MVRMIRDQLIGALPPEWPESLLPGIQASVESSRTKIVVLDDDPTGTQTVHDVPVLTEWSRTSLADVLAEPGSIVYILTNSRGLPLARAQSINQEIARNLRSAGGEAGRDFVVVSRGDSTLRGHYPGEVEALIAGLGRKVDGIVIIPFFLEGGRFTIDDVHYVAEGERLVPAAETEYARDAVFGYRSSNLRDWVSEKLRGQINPQDVLSISLKDLRLGGPEVVADRLNRVVGGQVCVVNAVTYRDVEVFVAGLLRAEAAGKCFIYRSAASFVRVRGGLAPRGPLAAFDLATPNGENGGLIIAGSYVKKSSAQIESALSLPGIASIEVSVEKVVDAASRGQEILRVANMANELLAARKDTLIYTSRRLITGIDQDSSLEIGSLVSAALVEIVDNIVEEPSWMIAKGGITSSDVATKGLGIKRALVLGQALPGVPIWRTGRESRWPGMIYVVFPGNVGAPEAIAEMIRILRGENR